MRSVDHSLNGLYGRKLADPARGDEEPIRMIQADRLMRDIELRILALRAECEGLERLHRLIQQGAYNDDHAPLNDGPVASGSEEYDVFICYNTDDVEEVTGIVRELEGRGIRAWFDRDRVLPGDPVMQVLNQVLGRVRSAVVLLGDRGLGRFQGREQEALLAQLDARNCRIIPVILASATRKPAIPALLAAYSWVDLRDWFADAISRLCWAITGRQPERGA
jgi:TIR domain